MKTLKQLNMRSFSETYRRALKGWPGALADLARSIADVAINLIAITMPITAPVVWGLAYAYRQLRAKP